MRRRVLVLGLLSLALCSCSRNSKEPGATTSGDASPSANAPPQPISANASFARIPSPQMMTSGETEQPAVGLGSNIGNSWGPMPLPAMSEVERQEKYDAALAEAMELLADGKLEQALTVFEHARLILETDTARTAIIKIKQRLAQDSAAERMAAGIQTVLGAGRAEEAAKLAREALQQFGDISAAAPLAKLAREANALLAVQADDKNAQAASFKQDYETALNDKNLRAAAIALEQAVQQRDDAALKRKLEDLQATLAKFDELRARAAQLRRHPEQLEAAVATLQEAAKLWDNAAIQQDIEACQLALQSRRDRLGVAEFEVRGDIGVPQAGAFVADEILPAFKVRYDLIERGQLAKIVAELKLESGLADDDLAQRKLAEAARVRYLVVGSITTVAGITVQARLVDVKTGLIVQTAKISARNADELTLRLPQLAQELLLADEQKLVLEQREAKNAAAVEALMPAELVALPPPPDAPLAEIPPPPPILPARPRPPAPPADLQPAQFQNLPAPPPFGQALPAVFLPPELELAFRRRSLFVALELGDNLFRRGRFREALVHFEFCLNLSPEQRDVRLRVERCRPLVPPAPVVVLPAPVFRQRLAVLDFLTFGDEVVVPRYLGPWTAENIAPYFGPQFQLVDRAELYWWMGRLGITQRDLLFDPVVRLYLGRALNVRYFLFGNLVQTASFDAITYLVDAEYGLLASTARIHARDRRELKLRLGELAWLTKLTPQERIQVELNNAGWDVLIIQIRDLQQRELRWQDCIEACRKALRLRPNNIEVLFILEDVQRRVQQRDLQEARQRDIVRQQRVGQELERHQMSLTRATETACRQAEQEAALRDAADQQRRAAQRETAARGLVVRAQVAFQGKRFGVAVQLFESAVALAPSDAAFRELALARAKAEETARVNTVEAMAAHEADLRRQRELELIQVRAQLDAERRQRDAEELKRGKFVAERDRQEYERLLDLAQKLSAQGKFDQAAAAAQKAKQLRPTAAADQLVSQLLIELAKANADKQGAVVRAELDRQLAAEREVRLRAEAEAERNRKLYDDLLAQGDRAVQARQYDTAIERYTAAKNLYPTDAVLTGLRRVETAKAQASARAEADRRRLAVLQQQIENRKRQLADARAALDAKQYDKAAQIYRAAQQDAPEDVKIEALTGLAKAEQARDQALLVVHGTQDEQENKAAFDILFAGGKANLNTAMYAGAILALEEAIRLYPRDQAAQAALAEARARWNSRSGSDANARAELEKNREVYPVYIGNGRRYLAAKDYDSAISSFEGVSRLVADEAAARFRQIALAARNDAELTQMNGLRKRLDEARKGEAVTATLTRVRSALAAGQIREAEQLVGTLDSNNDAVQKALADIRKAKDAAAALSRDQQDKARLAKVKTLLAEARTAIAARRLADAGKLVEQAAALAPQDPTVVQTQADLKQALSTADAAMKKRQLAFQNAMQNARVALKAKRFDDALQAVALAAQAVPDDKDAAALQTEIAVAKKNAAAAMQKEQEKKRECARLMRQGRTALTTKRYDDAVKAFQAALVLVPNDTDAAQLLADAKKALDAPKPPPALYTKELDAGSSFEKQGKYDQALAAYKAALRALPNDDAATKKSDFCQNMSDGAKAMQARKFADAIKAYEAALKVFPDDTAAKQALQRAKAGK